MCRIQHSYRQLSDKLKLMIKKLMSMNIISKTLSQQITFMAHDMSLTDRSNLQHHQDNIIFSSNKNGSSTGIASMNSTSDTASD